MRRNYHGPAAIEWALNNAQYVVAVTCSVEVAGDTWQGRLTEYPPDLTTAWAVLDTFSLRRSGFEPSRVHPAVTAAHEATSALGFLGHGPPPFWLRAHSTL